MDLDRLTTGEKTLGGSALVLFLFSFLDLWAKIEVKGGLNFTERYSAWSGAYNFLLKLALLLALVAVGLVIARAANVSIDIPWNTVYLGLAGATLVLLLLTLLIGPDEAVQGIPGIEISRGLGLFIGVVLAAIMAAGAWMHNNEAPATATGPAAPEPPLSS